MSKQPTPSPLPPLSVAAATAFDSEEASRQENAPNDIAKISDVRKFLLLIAFSIANFTDVMNTSSLFPGIPVISDDLELSTNEAVWLISAYQLTFASFLLLVCWRFLLRRHNSLDVHPEWTAKRHIQT
jgi:hypothetical protein